MFGGVIVLEHFMSNSIAGINRFTIENIKHGKNINDMYFVAMVISHLEQ
jgi:hypothetical protein